MNDDDFWGEFVQDYSGGTDALFNFGDKSDGGTFDISGALNSIGGADTMFDAMNYLDTSWLDSIVSGLDLKGGDASWLDTFDFPLSYDPGEGYGIGVLPGGGSAEDVRAFFGESAGEGYGTGVLPGGGSAEDVRQFFGDVSGLDTSGGDASVLDQYDFGRGEGLVDINDALASGATIDKSGNLVFDTGDGNQVVYRSDGTIETIKNDGSRQFYTTNEGKDYFIDYSDPSQMGALVETYGRDIGGEGPTRYSAYQTTDGRDYFVDYRDAFTPGELVETFSRAIGGKGPTRYTAYSGTGPGAKVVDYSDVYGPKGGTIRTTSDGKTTTYQDGKVTTNNGGGGGGGDIKKIIDTIRGAFGNKDNQLLMALLGGLLGLLGKGKVQTPGYQGGIPKYTATRGAPGQGVTYTKAAEGGLMGLAAGGSARSARYLRGGTDGMADKIKTDIDGKQPARLSHGEFVIPADVVSHLGNGNSDAGADVLYEMMAKVRKARTGNPKQGKQINPRKYTPA